MAKEIIVGNMDNSIYDPNNKQKEVAFNDEVNNALKAKANYNEVVKLTGNQTISGNKTFINDVRVLFIQSDGNGSFGDLTDTTGNYLNIWHPTTTSSQIDSYTNSVGFRDLLFNGGALIIKSAGNVIGAISGPEGFLINGQIVTSVSSGNLTVAIKTLAGTDPSTSDPVYCRIDGVVRSITSALSVTLNAGTNYFNAGSSELATKEIDYFACLGWTSVYNVVYLQVTRFPGGNKASYYSTTETNERHITNRLHQNPNDAITIIGRFNAILSDGGSGYQWSIPATSVIINRPIYETRSLSFQPIYGAGGSMTYSSVSTDIASYKLIGNKCFVEILADGTTGGTASNTLTATMPFNANLQIFTGGATNDGSMSISGFNQILGASNTLRQLKYDASSYGLGSARTIKNSFCYTI